MLSSHINRRHGFSALQLVLLLAMLLLGLALLLPAIQKVREAAARSVSLNNLKQLGLAMHNHHDVYKALPPGVAANGPTHYHLLPFIEQEILFRAADGASWKNGVYSKVIPVYLDPRDQSLPDGLYKNWLGATNYPVNWMVTMEGKKRLMDVSDGTSNTLMFSQRYRMCNQQPTAWGYPAIHTWAPIFAYYSEGKYQTAPSQDQCNPRLAQSLGQDIQVGLCDGRAITLSPEVRPSTWYYLCDPQDANVVTEGVHF